jgi:hypothetical protein
MNVATQQLRRFFIDGQRQDSAPEREIALLDSVGVDLRMTPLPMVFEHDTHEEFVAAGGWVATVPGELP